MIDALDADLVEALADVGDRILLVHVAVHGQPVALLACSREDLAELARWVVALVRVQPNADDPVADAERPDASVSKADSTEWSRRKHMISWERMPSRSAASSWARRRPADDGLEADPAAGMGLGVEEHLHVHEALGCHPFEVGHGQVVEVRLGQEDGHAFVVLGQERREVVEVVGRAHRRSRGVGQLEPVACRELELQLGLQRALDMQMQLSLGDGPDEGVDVHGRTSRLGQLLARAFLTADKRSS